ncbi:hypothetical protein SAMN05216389_105211 [Oceanobacillus limi]|uniref:Uncharacterized protein n=1 Tax=Oceanobacillus limi TaxID=930131 RepID=A0A1I0BVW0_9BACI|nr:hypothetical protein SAMN05216389_105211 [Oceanobacillus limi]
MQIYILHKTPENLVIGSRYSQCHDESMEEHVPPSPPIHNVGGFFVFLFGSTSNVGVGVHTPIPYPT